MFNISGTGLPYVFNTTISETVGNTLNTDLATGLTNCICKDGQSTPTANIGLGGFQLKNVAAPTVAGDAVIFPAPSSNVIGTTTNNNAPAGYIGEYISSIVGSGAPVSLTTNTAKTITSISLTAGDWDISGTVGAIYSVSCTSLIGSPSQVTDTIGAEDETISLNGFVTAGGTVSFPIPTARRSLSGTTTIYLVIRTVFGSGTGGGLGRISARRIR